MTEKRFQEYYQGNIIVSIHDKENDNELLNILQCVELLNEQHEEIKELQSELRFAKIEKEKLQDNIHITKAEMSKNILHLEEAFQYYKSKCASLEEGLFRQDREVSRLEKENEQLKSEINMLKTTIGRNEAYIKRLTHISEWH